MRNPRDDLRARAEAIGLLRLPGDAAWQGAKSWNEGLAEYERAPRYEDWRRKIRVESAIDLRSLTETSATQIHGGIDELGQTSPYASIALPRKDRSHLRVNGDFLARGELRDAQVQLAIDSIPAGELRIAPAQSFAVDVPIPPAADPEIVTLPLTSKHYVYDARSLRHCIVLEHHAIAAVTH